MKAVFELCETKIEIIRELNNSILYMLYGGLCLKRVGVLGISYNKECRIGA